ncbi:MULTISPECIES: cytochrome c oxidase subunit II [Pseudonocardia]|uniref:cytochrome-c oxidase n=1 Tax=Pseudonocardia alni subsp. carboxydivorans TaxID=415010 RepID=A0ABU9AAM9_PSEA5|nr:MULTISPECIES: cytochrome c oxidase subunit II [Pseudonocardia]MBO4238794.1 cytochrome C oxidase subunit II [Pseudonocardia alni]MCM3847740.1 cytochrome c oxidase subunit II [Pseudonocardia sp. DR1-2]WFG45493.1 cytochrome c oxidase subunit II [Pseudonocardia alni]
MARTEGRSRIARAAKVAVVGLLAAPALAGCSVQEVIRFGWPEGVTPEAESMRNLWTWSAIAALVVGVITWGAMFWAMILHRKRKDDDGSLPRQTQYNLPVELVFTAIPTVIVAVLFGFTVNVQNYIDKENPTAGGPADLRVDIVGFQWNWEFSYPDEAGQGGRPVSTLGTSDTIPIMVLPTDRSIQFTQRSPDVIHSFYVPEFLFKRDVFPFPERNEQDNTYIIDRIDREGAFVGRCAELCGTYHSQMNFEVRALEPALFDRYIQLRKETNPQTGQAYSTGEALQALNCGEWCAPEAISTQPFSTDRGQLAAQVTG